MYDKPGVRVPVTWNGEDAIAHGTPVFLEGKVGFLAKNGQPDRWTKPGDAAQIEPDEQCIIFIGGEHRLELAGALAGLAAGDLLYIDPDDNKVKKASEAAEGDLPLGVLSSVDTFPTPDVALVNCNALNVFMAVPAEA